MTDVFKKLVGVNVGDKIEKKGRFSYLSWSWAWQEVKNKYPDASFEVHDDVLYPDGTREVRVSVTIEGLTHMMWLPVMNNTTNAISNPNARDVSDARMRCLVKAIALHGLGLYIYAGEDIPQASAPQKPAPKQKETKVLSDKEQAIAWCQSLIAQYNKAPTLKALHDIDRNTPDEHLNALKQDYPKLHSRLIQRFTEKENSYEQ
mgnify:CR=1 FL=1